MVYNTVLLHFVLIKSIDRGLKLVQVATPRRRQTGEKPGAAAAAGKARYATILQKGGLVIPPRSAASRDTTGVIVRDD